MSLRQNTNNTVFENEKLSSFANEALTQVKKARINEIDIAIYLRVSSEEQASSELGILGQKLECENFIQEYFNGQQFNIYIYKDEGYSADKYLLHERPQMNKLIKDCQAGKISHIVTFRGDRIARKTEDDSWFRNTTQLLGVPVFTANDKQQYNDASPQNILMRGIMALLAEYEVAITKERIKATKAYQKKEKLFSGGDIPYGYRWVKNDEHGKLLDKNEKHIKKVESEITMYLKMRDKYLIENMGTTAIADWLNENGYRNQNGNKFNRDNVRNILRNPFYAGYFPTNVIERGRDVNGKKFTRKKPIEEWELIKSPLIPSVIEKKDWDMVVEKMEGRRTTQMPPKQISTDWLLSGLIKCSCGETWTIRDSGKRKSGKQYKYYSCKNKDCNRDVKSMKKEEIEKKTIEKFKKEILSNLSENDLLPSATEQIKSNMKTLNVNINDVQVNISSIKRRIKEIEDSRYNPKDNEKPISNEIFEKLWYEAKEELNEATAILNKLVEDKKLKEAEEEHLNMTLNTIDILFKAMDLSDDIGQTEKRVMLLTFIERINIDELENVFIKYREDMNDVPTHLKSKINLDLDETINTLFEEVGNELASGLESDNEDDSVGLLGNKSEQRHGLLHNSQHEYFAKNIISVFFTNMNNRTSI